MVFRCINSFPRPVLSSLNITRSSFVFRYQQHETNNKGKDSKLFVLFDDKFTAKMDSSSTIIVEDSLPRDILEVLDSMRRRKELSDVTLVVNEREITAHRAILAACSPYFRAMFLSGFSEASEHKIHLKEVDADAVQLIVDYFYTTELELDVYNVEEILRICVLLRLTNLVDHCETFLRRNMTPSNCIGLQFVADLFCLEDLSQHANRFALWHFANVYKEEEFKKMPYKQLKELVMDDSLKVQSEEMVFEAVWQWISHDVAARKPFVPEIMQYVRFPLMNLQYLHGNSSIKRLTSEYRMCKELVREAISYQTALENKSTSALDNFRVKPRMASEEIFVIGGWSNGQKISSVQCFNVDTLEWSVVAGMSVAHVSREDYIRVVAVGDELYTVSRYKVGKYDPIANAWIQVATGPDVQCKWAGVCEYEGYIYAVGGHSSMCAKQFDTETMTWRSLPSMMFARYYPGVAVVKGKIYAVGGLDHLWAPLNTAERYDPHANQWEAISSMSTARWSLGVAVLNDKLYAIGGCDNRESFSNSVEMYDPDIDRWSQAVASMNAGRRCLGVAVVNDTIYVVGGRVTNSIEYYDRDKNKWIVVGAVNTRCNFGCVALRIL